MAKAQTTSENPQGEVSQQDTPVLPMQYDVRIHSIQFDGPCRATASLNRLFCRPGRQAHGGQQWAVCIHARPDQQQG